MNEEKFRSYLNNVINQQGNNFNQYRINQFINDLVKLIPEQLKENINLLDIDDIDKLINIKDRLGHGGDLYDFNRSEGNGRPSSALYQYINFLDDIDYKGFEQYLNSKTYAPKTIRNTLNYIKRTLKILKNFDLFKGRNSQKILKFAIQDNSFKKEFDKFHEYNPANDSTFTNFRESAKKYKDYINSSKLDNLIQNIIKVNTKNIILYGSPGIGKTYNYKNLIYMIEKGKNEKEIFDTISKNENILQNDIDIPNERVKFITFHQSYSYEDFIEGFRPQEDGTIKLEDGIFKIICDEANENKIQNYYLVIDEINRGNISKIFGELITLIEEDKRDNLEVVLPYSKKPFKISSNLYIIATMNSTDKSIATIDIALRRRFTFIKMKPNSNLVNYPNAKEFMKKVNKYILENLNEDYLIGHSYFMSIENDEDLEFITEYKIKPLLEEYFYANDKSVDDILDEIENKGRFSER